MAIAETAPPSEATKFLTATIKAAKEANRIPPAAECPAATINSNALTNGGTKRKRAAFPDDDEDDVSILEFD